MKKQYEKPCSSAMEMVTESIIATSDVVNVQATLPSNLNMEVKGADVWGAWE